MQKQYRLKKNEEIGKIVQKRISARGQFYTVYYKYSDKVEIAFSVSKKYGNAVERNYAKRVMREICRDVVNYLPCVKLVIVVKKEAKKTSYFIFSFTELSFMPILTYISFIKVFCFPLSNILPKFHTFYAPSLRTISAISSMSSVLYLL